MPKTTIIGLKNRRIYLKAPSWILIEQFVKECGVNKYQFERFYHIPYNTLAKVKWGERELPAEFWHIIYEKIKPAYGEGYLEDYSNKWLKSEIKHYIPKNLPKINSVNDMLNKRLELLPHLAKL